MFDCSACLLRACRYLVHDAARPRLAQSRPFSSSRPVHSTLRQLSKGHHRRVYVDTLRELSQQGLKYPASKRRNAAKEVPTDRRNRRAIAQNERHLVVDREQYALRSAAAREVEWINDPLRLAERVLTILREEDGRTEPHAFDRALELVRASEKRSTASGRPQGAIDNVVSWNHLIDWCMEQKKPREAVKIYNEMKKRGHKPDAHSYTIMLRGFAANVDKPNAVSGAMTVYRSIRASNSEVRHNSLHLNAAANVFARAVDMDSLWLILGEAKDRGPGSPDSATYTIVLNALQKDLIKKTAQVLAKDAGANVQQIFDTAVQDGRKVWLDVVRKWQDADISVDEALVCAMGRLLLMSKRIRDVLDVFKLVQQTMRIPIPFATESHGNTTKTNEESGADNAVVAAFEESLREQARATATRPQATTTVQGPAKALFATPGNNTLSMLVEAATVVKKIHWGKAYWDLLTDANGPYAIRADPQNVIAYLRLLRVSRASKAAVQLLQRDWPAEVKKKLHTRGNFVIAMSACMRDKNNPNVFDNASQIVDLMQQQADVDKEARLVREEEEAEEEEEEEERGEKRYRRSRREREGSAGEVLDVDPKVMTMYLNLAMYTTRGINSQLKLRKQDDGHLDFERDRHKNNTFRALRRLEGLSPTVVRMLKARLAELDMQAHSPRERLQLRKQARKSWFVDYTRTQERLEDLVGLLRAMVGAYDRILVVDSQLQDAGNGPLDVAWLEEVRLNRARFTAWLGKIDFKTRKSLPLTKTGLHREYEVFDEEDKERRSPDLSYGKVDQEGRLIDNKIDDAAADDVDELINDSHALGLARTPAAAKLHKAVSKEVKTVQTQRENAKDWLSRRQRQEKEKFRRQDRASRLYPGRADQHQHQERGGADEARRPGWGGGYDRLAERMGLEETSGMVDLRRPS